MAKEAYSPQYRESRALIVGIDSYFDPQFSALGKAESDARSFAKLLEAPESNFRVNILLVRVQDIVNRFSLKKAQDIVNCFSASVFSS